MSNALDRLLGMQCRRYKVKKSRKIFLFLLNLYFIYFFTGSKEEELDSDDLDDDDDDDEENDDENDAEEEEGSSSHAEMNGSETLNGLRRYMDQMDQELMSTNIGQSFNLTVNYCCEYNQWKIMH